MYVYIISDSRRKEAVCSGCRKTASYMYIYSVPEHKRNLGNEIADEVAKSGICQASELVQ